MFSGSRLLLVSTVFVLAASTSLSVNQRETRRQLERVKKPPDVGQSYAGGTADGLKITLLQKINRSFEVVELDKSFINKDAIKLRLQSNFDGFVYLVNITPGDEKRLLFPLTASRANNVRAGRSYDLPQSAQFVFDAEPGVEQMLVILSRAPVGFIEDILVRTSTTNYYIALPRSAVRQLDRLLGKTVKTTGTGVTTQTRSTSEAGLRTRMLTLDKRKESAIAVLSGAATDTTSRFKTNEVAVIVIQLNHN